MPVCKLCDKYIPNRVKINGKTLHTHKRRYCLECQPPGSGKKKLLLLTRTNKPCSICKQNNPLNKYWSRRDCGKNGTQSICKKCSSVRQKRIRRENKQTFISYKGGNCQKCGYNRCIEALDFHHKDPTKKLFGLSKVRHMFVELSKEVKRELDKCILLCSNCHREEHAGFSPLTS